MGGFTGFGPKALPFFEALRFHQSREWFEENRGLYESDVLAPMTALIEDLTEAFAKRRIPLRGDGRRSIFRLNRDIRFSKDKSPYKTHAGAVMSRSGSKKDNGLLYIHIDPAGCFTAAGFYMPEAPALAALRKAILAHPNKAKAMLARLEKGGLELDTFDQLTRVPRGFEELKGGPLDGLIRMKSLVVEEKLPERLVKGAKLTGAIVDFAVRAKPLLEFGWQAVD
ncbi:MAG TPA: TIGR02453 family protein [Bauldia sp.]|nr:TIGR02453 family protein [Bauldia sp.]